jgi:hypothetical protein
VLKQNVQSIDWQALGPLDLVICGDALGYLTKAELFALLDKAVTYSRVVLVSIPVRNAQQQAIDVNAQEANLKTRWSHEQCLATLPDIISSHVEHSIGSYFLSRRPEDRASLLYFDALVDADLNDPIQLTRIYRAALAETPGDTQLLHKYCFLTARHSLGEVVETLEEICMRSDQPLANRIQQLGHLVFFKERLERLKRKLPMTNASDADDLHFRFTGPEIEQWQAVCRQWLDMKPASHGGLTMMALALLAQGRTTEAEVFLARARAQRPDIHTAATFNSDFHAGLEDKARAALGNGLPPVRAIVAAGESTDTNVIFMACDGAYFETYGWILARSFAANTRNAVLALHIFDVTDVEAEVMRRDLSAIRGLAFAMSIEWTGLKGTAGARGYYHAVRFIRLSHFLDSNPWALVWLVDADSLFVNALEPLFQLLQGYDVGLWMAPGRMEPHSKITACLVGVAPTAAGRGYIRRVAGYIAEYMKSNQLFWGIDQAALYAVYMYLLDQGMPLATATVPPHIQDGTCRSDAIFWGAKSDNSELAVAMERYRKA